MTALWCGVVVCVAPTHAAAPRTLAEDGAGTFRQLGVDKSFGAEFTRYRQYVGGLPVLGSEVVVTEAGGRDGDLVLGAGRVTRRSPSAGSVRRTHAIAVARQATAVESLRAPIAASRAVLRRVGGARVVWRVVIPASRPLGSFEVLVDARSSTVLRVRDLLRRAFTATGQGSVFDPNPIVAQGSRTGLSDNGDADSAALTALRDEVALPRLDDAVPGCLEGRWVHVTLPAGEVCANPTRDFRSLTRSDDGFEAVMAYFHVDRAQNYIQQTLGFSNVRNVQQRVRANEIFLDGDDDPLPPDEQDNSFYDPSTGEISLGTGGTDDGEDGEVIAHEYGHAIQDGQVPSWGLTDEGGAMGEGFGDYLAAALSNRFSPNATFDPCVAEWDELGFGSLDDVPCLRRVDGDLTAAQVGPGTVCDARVHCAGEAWSGALWDIRAQIGAETADRLVLQSHFSLTPTAGFHEGALALLAADAALYGGVHVDFMRALLTARGLLDVERLDDEPSGATPLGVPGSATGSVDAVRDPHDLYALSLTAGRGVLLRLAGSGGEMDLRVLRPGATTTSDQSVVAAETAGPNETLGFTPSASGVHYLDVAAITAAGTYTVTALPDGDRDLVADGDDNCPAAANTAQADRDRDGIGDACDAYPSDPRNDRDGDRIGAADDNCPRVANRRQRDWDGDGRGDVCDRSARVKLRRLRSAGRVLALRATLRPNLLGRRDVKLGVARRSCVRRCVWRPVKARVRARGAGRGRVRLTLRLPAAGEYRVRARLVDRRYVRARSRPLIIAID